MASAFTKDNFLIVLAAPSGGGKSTICRAILERTDNILYSVSYTTRKPRFNEINGQDYNFVSEEVFQKHIANNDFIEYAKVHNNWYGTSKSYILDCFDKKKHVIMDIDVQGTQSILNSKIDVVTIFLLPPDTKTLEKRLRDRNTDSDEVIRLRLSNAGEEVKMIDSYQYLVINDDLETAINDVLNIINAEENRAHRYKTPDKIFYGGL